MPRDRRTSANRGRPAAGTSWDPLAAWYDGWVGEHGSEHHRQVAVPATLRLLNLKAGEEVLDVGAGQGVLAPAVIQAGARYTGIDASPRLLQMARRRHGGSGRFILGDARRLLSIPDIHPHVYDAVVFLLSLQDMDPLQTVIAGAADVLKSNGRVVLLLTHPAFRVPRQSGWGWDEGRKLVYRRIDRYLSPLPVPMKPLPGRESAATTRSFHRSLGDYVNALGEHGLFVDRMDELPGIKVSKGEPTSRAEKTAREEIPLFLGVRARKLSVCLSGSGDPGHMGSGNH